MSEFVNLASSRWDCPPVNTESVRPTGTLPMSSPSGQPVKLYCTKHNFDTLLSIVLQSTALLYNSLLAHCHAYNLVEVQYILLHYNDFTFPSCTAQHVTTLNSLFSSAPEDWLYNKEQVSPFHYPSSFAPPVLLLPSPPLPISSSYSLLPLPSPSCPMTCSSLADHPGAKYRQCLHLSLEGLHPSSTGGTLDNRLKTLKSEHICSTAMKILNIRRDAGGRRNKPKQITVPCPNKECLECSNHVF